MKSRENLVRLKKFQVSERRRQLGQLDLMIGEFERMAAELDAQIAAEERKAGIADTNHFAYPTFAKAARSRRDNLYNSQKDLRDQRLGIEEQLTQAEGELTKAEMLDARDHKQREGDNDSRTVMHG